MTTTRDCVNVLKSVIREPYAWPGGYERAVIANDGCLICHGCCKENFRLMVHSTKGDYRDGWQVMGALTIGCDIDPEDAEYCANCNREF